MAEGTYEHACMRAELLGLEKPNKEDFARSNPPSSLADSEKLQAAQFEEVSLQNEELKNVGGGLTELNTILSGTQRRLNKLKGVCGSLTDLLRNKLGGSKDNISYSTDPSYLPGPASKSGAAAGGTINQALDDLDAMKEAQSQQVMSQVDKLDALLNKADNAQASMDHQNKQMKKFLK